VVGELSARRRYLILCICCMSLLLGAMDISIVNVALPSIGRDLHASVSGLQWTIDGYSLVIASFLIMSGSTADRLGRRRTFQAGLMLFTLGSLLCSVAPSLGWLIAFRMVQALGGSMLNPVAMSIITNVFIDPRERARAIGVWGAVVGVGLGLGPVVGGLLTETIGWRSIFWVNVPIGVAALILAALFVPESKAERARRIDPLGQLLVLIVLATVTYAIIEAPEAGWASPEISGLFAAAIAALVALLIYERRRVEPLIEARLFRSAPFSGATIIAVCGFAFFSGFLFLNSLYLQDVRGLSALHAGLALLPMALMTLLVAPISGRMVGAQGPRVPLLVASVALSSGALILTQLSAHTGYAWLFISYTLAGIGFGFVNPPITNTAVAGLPRSQAGVAAAFASTSRQIGAALGVAIVGSIVNSGSGRLRPGTLSAASHPAWWILFALCLAILVLAAVTTTDWARDTAARTAALMARDPGSGSAGELPAAADPPRAATATAP
jgi:EmrB/QacA subfamily drug resistance transporter